MTKKDKAQLTDALNQICAYIGVIACVIGDEPQAREKAKAGMADPTPPPEESTPTPVPSGPKPEAAGEPVTPEPEAAHSTSVDTEPTEAPDSPAPPVKEVKYEEVRAVLAEKSRTGYRAEVKALLTAHGVKQLSEITDPAIYAQLMAEAGEIGNG